MEGSLGRFDGIIEQHGGRPLRRRYEDQVERAISNVKRTAFDKSFRQQWYRAGALRKKRSSAHRPQLSGARR